MTEKKEGKKAENSHKNEVIEIPLGKITEKIRKNPWIVSTVVLAIVVTALLFYKGTSISSVDEKTAADNLVSYINSVGQGEASLVSSAREGQLYKVTVNYQGQNIPVYVTLDGKYLVADVIPLSGTGTQDNSENNQVDANEKVEVEVGDSPILGSKSAQVTIVEFSDYQCPFCRKFWQDTYSQLKKDYIDTGKVKLAFRDFPLDFHPGAISYARAARCVKEKGGDAAYWKMHDKIFEEQNKLDGGSVSSTVAYVGDDIVKKWAKDIGYDITSCFDSKKFDADIQQDLAYGQQVGVSGTPGFFVNGNIISGAQPYSVFKQAIDAELNA